MRLMLLFIAALLLTGKTDFKNIPLKDYYWQIKDYSQAKVLVFECHSDTANYLAYYHFKSTSDSTLSVTVYSQNFVSEYYQEVVYRPNGAYITTVVLDDYHNHANYATATITGALDFSLTDFETSMYSGLRASFAGPGNHSYNYRQELRFIKFENRSLNDSSYSTLIAKLTRHEVETEDMKDDYEWSDVAEAWFSKGIRMTYLKWKRANLTVKYSKTISAAEFDKMRQHN